MYGQEIMHPSRFPFSCCANSFFMFFFFCGFLTWAVLCSVAPVIWLGFVIVVLVILFAVTVFSSFAFCHFINHQHLCWVKNFVSFFRWRFSVFFFPSSGPHLFFSSELVFTLTLGQSSSCLVNNNISPPLQSSPVQNPLPVPGLPPSSFPFNGNRTSPIREEGIFPFSFLGCSCLCPFHPPFQPTDGGRSFLPTETIWAFRRGAFRGSPPSQLFSTVVEG